MAMNKKAHVILILFCLALGAATHAAAAEYAIWTGEGDGTSWSDDANWYRRTSSRGGQVYAMATNAPAVVLDSEFTAATVWFNTEDHALTGPIRLSGGQLNVLTNLSFGANPMGGGFFCVTPGNTAHYFRANQNAKILAEDISIIGGSESAPMDYFDVGANEYQRFQTQCEYTQTGGQFRVWTKTFNVGGLGTTKGIGILDLSAVDNGMLKATRAANIGSFRGTCRGTVALGRGWTVAFGTAEAPLSTVNVGYNSYADSVADGNYSMVGGSFGLFATNATIAAGWEARSPHYARMVFDGVTNLTVHVPGAFTLSQHGRNYNEMIDMSGLFDAYNCTNIVFNVGKIILGITVNTGAGITGSGHLRLGRGRGVVGDLAMGTQSATSKVRGVLDLRGMELVVTTFLNCGVSGIVSNTVDGVSSGLALVDACANCPTNAYLSPMAVDFAADPEPSNSRERVGASWAETANDWYWGFKWEGNHVAEIEALMNGSQPKLVVDASGLSAPFAARCGVHYSAADNATYLGVPLWRRPMDGFVIMIR